MASLGYAATGAGQGVLQQRQYNDQQARQQQQFGLQERQVGLQERDYEDSKSRANRDFALRRIERIEDRLKDRRNLTPGEIAKMERELDKHYSSYPDLDLRGQAPAPGAAPTTTPSAQTTAEQPQAPPRPELYGLGQQQPEPLPTDPNFGAGQISPGPSQFDPMGQRPIPNTGAGVTGSQNPPVAGSFPPNPFPPQPSAAAPPRGPMGSQPTADEMPLAKQISLALQQQALAKFQESKNPNLSPAERDAALSAGAQLAQQIAQMEGTSAATVLQQLEAAFYPAKAVTDIEAGREKTRAQQMETDVFRPRELDIKEMGEALDYQAKMLDAIEKSQNREMEARRYNLDVARYEQSKREFDLQANQRLATLGLTVEQINEYKSRPDWRTKLMAETAAQTAYGKNPISGTYFPGPTLGTFNQMTGGAPGAGGPVHTYETFPHSAYINDPASSPQSKVQFYKSQGWQVPPELIAAASKAKPKAKAKK